MNNLYFSYLEFIEEILNYLSNLKKEEYISTQNFQLGKSYSINYKSKDIDFIGTKNGFLLVTEDNFISINICILTLIKDKSKISSRKDVLTSFLISIKSNFYKINEHKYTHQELFIELKNMLENI